MNRPNPDAPQALAEVGAVLVAAHRRLEAKAKMKVARDADGVTDEQAITGEETSDVDKHDISAR